MSQTPLHIRGFRSMVGVHIILYEDGGVGGFIEFGGGFVYAEKLAVNQAFDFLAHFVGITMGIEFLLNVGAFGPFPEKLFKLNLGAGFFEGEAFVFDSEAFGIKIAAAQSGEITAKITETAEFDFRVAVWSRHGAGDGGETDLQAADEFGAHFFEGGGVKVVR